MRDLTPILREAFLSLSPVRAVEVERRGNDYFVYVTKTVAADEKPIHGVHAAIRKMRPDLSVEVFVEEHGE